MEYKKILCVDFDNTLCYDAYPDINTAKRKLIHKLILWYCKFLQKRGWYIILNTLRKKQSLQDAILFCNLNDFFPDLCNKNAKWLIDKWGDSRKIACDINIDDTNIGLLGWILRRYVK